MNFQDKKRHFGLRRFFVIINEKLKAKNNYLNITV